MESPQLEETVNHEKDMNIIELCDNPLVLIDCDILVYKACAICEKKTKFIDVDGTVTDSFFIGNESSGYQYIDYTINKIKDDLSATEIRCFLSTTDKDKNYRTHVKGADKVYKGNRKKQKPYYYKHMRSYFVNTYDAFVCPNDEADDMIGRLLYEDYQQAFHYIERGDMSTSESDFIEHNKCTMLAASTDKDFWQFPGYLWNFDKCELSYSDHFGYIELVETVLSSGKKTCLIKGRGFLYFCAQMITGDAADNITGIFRCGHKKAYAALNDCFDNRGAWKAVVDMYRDKGIDDEQLLAHATLLWITHEEGRLMPHSHLIEEMV